MRRTDPSRRRSPRTPRCAGGPSTRPTSTTGLCRPASTAWRSTPPGDGAAGPVALGTAGLGTSTTGEVEVFYALLPPARGRGVARDAVRVLTALAIRSGAPRVTAGVLEGNERSSRVLTAAGYRCAGRERDPRDGAVATRWEFLPG